MTPLRLRTARWVSSSSRSASSLCEYAKNTSTGSGAPLAIPRVYRNRAGREHLTDRGGGIDDETPRSSHEPMKSPLGSEPQIVTEALEIEGPGRLVDDILAEEARRPRGDRLVLPSGRVIEAAPEG